MLILSFQFNITKVYQICKTFFCFIFYSTQRLKKEIELETKNKENANVNNAELERSVRAMEKNVMQLESGNLEADDSEIKQKFDNQRQLNVQLQEQKRWLEHELEQVSYLPAFQIHKYIFSIIWCIKTAS